MYKSYFYTSLFGFGNVLIFGIVHMEFTCTSAEKWPCFRLIMLTESSRNLSHDEALDVGINGGSCTYI